jgi:hypothetical protein
VRSAIATPRFQDFQLQDFQPLYKKGERVEKAKKPFEHAPNFSFFSLFLVFFVIRYRLPM